jgi:pyrroloquinoline quinone (PQQ) biosynthesis protein C
MTLPPKEFVRRLDSEVDALHQRIMNHPLFTEWFDGKLPLAVMRGYAVQAYLWKDQNEHLMPLVLPGAPEDVRASIIRNLASEAGEGAEERHGELLIRFGEEIGARREDFFTTEPILEVEALMNFLYRLYHGGQFLDHAAAVNFAAEGLLVKKYPRIAAALRKHYDVSPRGLAFFDIHVTADAEHSGEGIEILEKYAVTAEQQARARRLAVRALEFRLLAIEGCYQRFRG